VSHIASSTAIFCRRDFHGHFDVLERGLHAGFAIGVHTDFDGVVYYSFYSYQYSHLSFFCKACFDCIFVMVLFIIV